MVFSLWNSDHFTYFVAQYILYQVVCGDAYSKIFGTPAW
jgi:hypothetical protein